MLHPYNRVLYRYENKPIIAVLYKVKLKKKKKLRRISIVSIIYFTNKQKLAINI